MDKLLKILNLVGQVAKAIGAAVAAGGGVLIVAQQNGVPLTQGLELQAGIAALIALIGVYTIPNAAPPKAA